MSKVFRRNGQSAGRGSSRRGSRAMHPEVSLLELKLLLSTASAVAPSPYEQYMLELINRARANPAAEGQRLLAIAHSDPAIEQATANWDLSAFVKEISSFSPEPPLAFNTRLIAAAQNHDQAMLAANDQFHTAAGSLATPAAGQTDSDGLPYLAVGNSSWATAENIFAYSSNVATRSETQVVDYFEEAFFLDWGNPDFGHLKNLLSPGPGEATSTEIPLSEIGIGLLTGVTPTVAPPPTAEIVGNAGLNVGPDLITEDFGWVSGQQFLTGVAYNDQAQSGLYMPGEGLGSVQIQAVGTQGEGTFQTTTWASGGYSLELPSGTYTVTATGGGLAAASSTSVTIGVDNVAWNVTSASVQTPTIPTTPTTPLAPTPTAPTTTTTTTTTKPVSTAPSAPQVTTTKTPTVKIPTPKKPVPHPKPKPVVHHPKPHPKPVKVHLLRHL